jgi:acyl-CoA reductase-like NAD-dependent aldehyde dehydrogenase
MTSRISHWIDGSITAGTSGRTGPVFNPATGLLSGEVDLASTDEVNAAVAGAKAAAREWRTASLSRRAAVLFAFRELLHNGADELAKIVTAERRESEALRHSCAAALALATAAYTSSVEAKSTSPDCSPVAGLKTAPVRPEVPARSAPSIQWEMREVMWQR